jgi:hypothetical protein
VQKLAPTYYRNLDAMLIDTGSFLCGGKTLKRSGNAHPTHLSLLHNLAAIELALGGSFAHAPTSRQAVSFFANTSFNFSTPCHPHFSSKLNAIGRHHSGRTHHSYLWAALE